MSVPIHTHANIAQGGGPIKRAALESATVSLAGTLPHATVVDPGPPTINFSVVDIELNPYAFFPMIHDTGTLGSTLLRAHTVDGLNADAPRFAFVNLDTTIDFTYDVDYRHLTV